MQHANKCNTQTHFPLLWISFLNFVGDIILQVHIILDYETFIILIRRVLTRFVFHANYRYQWNREGKVYNINNTLSDDS